MPWLSATTILPMAGYPAAHARAAEAISFAETCIEAYTRAKWGAVVADSIILIQDARSYFLLLPLDVQTVTSVSPIASTYTTTLKGCELWKKDSGGYIGLWDAGTYQIEITRGYTTIPQDVIKAASLLAGYYLSLSDPEKSRYDSLSIGDWSSGRMSGSDLPVPEAQAILRRYRTRVGATC
ncbi:hypothetical protein [Deinococcus cellulosilyticus]|uniref:Uncharacterized protein n=1 Tax=Deinococcus cellulosilyticus (strain DSM 18568 / NBRC 106333 / KACC 11606 / 5516J-15) TaxID=1223518 RepID=A0A511N2Y3_DEIC1|nr:hypothetical protein [Deinococcus cellulosilyticus]GEM47210.1 hypothetical protein DC3_28450 [Deinococcus cellulosilyticus NBRC 106333 = KACC 11606]